MRREPSNLDLMARHGRAGCVGLLGGTGAVDRSVRFGQRALCAGRRSVWSHVVLFEGTRVDGRVWFLESDLDVRGGQLRNGVQENRIDKYADEKVWPNVAVLDFGVGEERAHRMIATGLDFVSRRVRYAVGGVLKTYWAILRRTLNQDKKKDAVFCSAFVRALYMNAGLDLAPEIAVRHTAPEHIARTPVAHARHEIIRDP